MESSLSSLFNEISCFLSLQTNRNINLIFTNLTPLHLKVEIRVFPIVEAFCDIKTAFSEVLPRSLSNLLISM